MNLIPAGVTRNLAHQMLVAKKNSPHIFFAGGVVGVVASTFLACRATLGLEDTIDKIKIDIDNAKVVDETLVQPEREHVRNVSYAYLRGLGEISKLYGPSVVLGVASIGALTGSHIQLTRRNSALTATIALVSQAFDGYRLRVQEELGEERENEIYRGIHDEEVVDAKGKKSVVKVVGTDGRSPYAVYFDRSNPNWKPNSEMNRIFIEAQQRYYNHRLHAYGFVILNDIYETMSFDRTTPGCVVGWTDDGSGDCYIDFQLYTAQNSESLFADEANFWIDFNVDGVVYDKI